MSTVASRFGAKAVFHPSGTIRTETFFPTTIPSAAIYKGDLVKLSGDGDVIQICAANDASVGVFDGCEYVDATGKPVVSPYWPASLSGVTNIKFHVITDILTVFEIQSQASRAATDIGDSADVVVAAGNANTGISGSYLNTTQKGAAAVGNFRIMGLGGGLDNAWGDAFTIVRVTRAKDQRFTQVNSL